MSVNLSLPEAEVRENRLGTLLAYHGSAGDLSKRSAGKSIDDNERTYSQCSDCAQGCAEVLTYYIQGAAVVIHSPIGCAHPAQAYVTNGAVAAARGVQASGIHAISTNISEEDTVYGGVQKLRQAILTAYERFAPTVIFVHSSCAAGIIGDDIESETDALEDELGIPVIPVYCEGFKSKVWSSGFDAVFHGILRKIVREPKKKDKDLVNIFNFQGVDTFTPLLKNFGLKANYLVPLATVDALAAMGEAVCSTHICETLGTYVADALEKNYGVPQLRAPSPYGVNWTDEWIRAVCEITDRSELAEDFIQKEHERIREPLAKLRSELGGKKVYIIAGDTFAHNLSNLVRQLDMELVGVTTLHHDQVTDNEDLDFDTLSKLVRDSGDIPHFTVCNRQPYQMIKVLKKLKPDVIITRHFNLAVLGTKLGIPAINEGDANNAIGYDGILDLGNRLLTAMAGKNFLKTISGHVKFPYSQWWMEQEDPYYFENGGF